MPDLLITPKISDSLSLSEIEQRDDLWRGKGAESLPRSWNTGYNNLDHAIHGGGWPAAGLLELLIERPGIQELSLLMPAIAQHMSATQRVAFVGLPYLLMPTALRNFGINPSQIWRIQTPKLSDQLWAMQQLLKSGHCFMVVAWQLHHKVNSNQLRKLQLAAKSGSSCGVLIRSKKCIEEASPAPMRIQLKSSSEKGLELKVIKQPGTFSGQVTIISSPLLARKKLLEKPLPFISSSELENKKLKPKGLRNEKKSQTKRGLPKIHEENRNIENHKLTTVHI